MAEDELPLFPLNVVLFPGMPLPLHIFEPRYREMIGLCAREERPFGVLLIKEGREVGAPATPFRVGTLARIVGLERMEDGRMNIMTIGTQRFRLLDYSTDKRSYLTGQAELIEDEPSPADLVGPLAAEVAALAQRYVAILQTATGRDLTPLELPTAPSELSYVVGATLQVENLERQQLLEAASANQRLAMEKRLLQRETERIEELLRRRGGGALGPFSRN